MLQIYRRKSLSKLVADYPRAQQKKVRRAHMGAHAHRRKVKVWQTQKSKKEASSRQNKNDD